MPLYKYTSNVFSEIKEKPFQLEREIVIISFAGEIL